MRSGLKMVSPPGFLCNNDKEIQCILICFKTPNFEKIKIITLKLTISNVIKVWGLKNITKCIGSLCRCYIESQEEIPS